jgi:hypothetical protein
MVEIGVLPVPLGLDPALMIVIKGRSVSLELELGCKFSTRKDLACIKFNS